MIDVQEIIDLSGLDIRKVRNIYMFGSRVYGYNRPDSDHDILMTACSLEKKREIKGEKYNIHIHTPDLFRDRLFNHDIHNLECIFAPESAKLRIIEETPFTLNKDRLKRTLLSASKQSWEKGGMDVREGDIERGIKGCFHSLRILMFGKQIAMHGRIVDFSEANELFVQMKQANIFEWYQVKDDYLPLKIKLEKEFKAL